MYFNVNLIGSKNFIFKIKKISCYIIKDMSYNRTFYDKCAYDKALQDSMKVGNYYLSTPVSACNPCYPAPPTVRLQKGGISIYQDKSPKDLLINIHK